VLEPLAGYLRLAEVLWEQPTLAGAYNFGPNTHEAATVRYVVELARGPSGICAVSYENDSNGVHEASRLALETAKSRQLLNLQPRWPLDQAVGRTMAWYAAQSDGASARDLCEADIAAYEVCEVPA
jgi:CDP-glucose 4,6-dehydratase